MPTMKKLGKWVFVEENLPKTSGIKITQTKEGVLGVAIFFKSEWHHLLPTYFGEVYKWYECVNSDGDEVEFVTDPTSTAKGNVMKQSAGTIIVNEKCEILMGHVTNSFPQMWDLPKGMVEDNESPIDAAIRECKEEFGLTLQKSALMEIGNCKYNSQKNLWLFITMVEKKTLNMDELKCDSIFIDTCRNAEFPEVNGYRWVKFSDIPFDCAKSMEKLLHSLYEPIRDFVRYGVVDKFKKMS